MLGIARRLRSRGVLGINARNIGYIQRYNLRSHYPLVDDKLSTKRLALAAGIAVPELYGVMSTPHDTQRLAELVTGRQAFVIKPAHGSGGDGILVIGGQSARRRDQYRLLDGSFINEAELQFHATNIISGRYSLGGHRDQAMIEYCVQPDPVFAQVSHRGVPDVRVLVFRGYPVLAMLRLPTRESRGKANLHQGAIGVGIDLLSGRTTHAVYHNEAIDEHPDTGVPVSGLQIPHWPRLLELATGCYELTGLGYLGVDLVLDSTQGPLILELNARPGLNIQIANRVGLQRRLSLFADAPHDQPVAARLALLAKRLR